VVLRHKLTGLLMVLMRHPRVILVGALVAVVVLYPFRVLDAADAASATPVEAETFDVRPTGTSVVTDATLYSNEQALKFSSSTAIAKEQVNFTSSGDVVLMARAGQRGGSPKLRVSVNGTFTAPARGHNQQRCSPAVHLRRERSFGKRPDRRKGCQHGLGALPVRRCRELPRQW
jgi:hypothetical protein